MNEQTQPTISAPRLIPSFVSGFNAVASHIGLIVLPILLDLFLLFGPHMRIRAIINPFVQSLANMPGMNDASVSELMKANQEMWKFIAEQFNLATLLRTYPVGLPSLFAASSPLKNPLGSSPIHDVSSVLTGAGWWFLFVIVGLVLGSLYFRQIASVVVLPASRARQNLIETLRATGQTLVLTFVVAILLVMVGVPAAFILSLMMLISPAAAQIGFLMLLLLAAWIFIPLVFAPHGIFALRQNALASMLTSTRLVRVALPNSSLFILMAFIISQGMDMLWNSPAPDTWLVLVAVAGHAFITTGLLAASFVYYRDGVRWMQDLLNTSLNQRISQA